MENLKKSINKSILELEATKIELDVEIATSNYENDRIKVDKLVKFQNSVKIAISNKEALLKKVNANITRL